LKLFWRLEVGSWNFGKGTAGVGWCLGVPALITRGGLREDFGQVALFGEVIEKDGDHALEVSFFVAKKPGEERERKQEEPE